MISQDVKNLNPGINLKESEADFESWCDDYAHQTGWRIAGFRPARVFVNGVETYRTPVSKDGKGFPDRIYVRDRVVIAELKTETGGYSSKEQKIWVELLQSFSDYPIVWRPSMREIIMEILR